MTSNNNVQIVYHRRGPLEQRGMTLLELIMVLLVLAVVSAMALPSFRSFTEGNNLRRVTNDLALTIKTARADAVNLREEVSLAAAADGWSDGWVLEGIEQEDKVFSGAQGITVATNDNITDVRFRRNGTLDKEVTFTVCANQRGRQLEISLLGRISNTEVVCP